jgi:hypothetical protein
MEDQNPSLTAQGSRDASIIMSLGAMWPSRSVPVRRMAAPSGAMRTTRPSICVRPADSPLLRLRFTSTIVSGGMRIGDFDEQSLEADVQRCAASFPAAMKDDRVNQKWKPDGVAPFHDGRLWTPLRPAGRGTTINRLRGKATSYHDDFSLIFSLQTVIVEVRPI